MRIQSTKYYVMVKELKDSFGNWTGKKEYFIVSGHKAKNERPYITQDFNPAFVTDDSVQFELHDGHIRGHRPIVTSVRRMLDFIDNNKFSLVSVL